MVKEAREDGIPVVLVDAGGFCGKQDATWEPRAHFVLEMMRQLGYDAGTIGGPEARFGAEMLRGIAAEPAIPLVSANLFDEDAGRPLLPPYLVLQRGPQRVGITAVTMDGPEALAELGIRCDDPATALARVLPELRAAVDVVVLLARMGLSDAKDLVKSQPERVDIVLVGNARHPRGTVFPESGGAVYVVSGSRGQSIARARVAAGRTGKRSVIVGDDIALNRTVPHEEETLALVDEFLKNLNDSMAQEAVQFVAERAAEDGHYYLGAESCRECHRREFDLWMETPHSDAFATLEREQAERLPECFSCHVTGNATDAGYDPRLDGAEALANVQCEVCHDKGSRHSRDGSYGKSLLMESCVSCHNQEQSPDWDPEVYWLMMEH